MTFKDGDRVMPANVDERSIYGYRTIRGTVLTVADRSACVRWDCNGPKDQSVTPLEWLAPAIDVEHVVDTSGMRGGRIQTRVEMGVWLMRLPSSGRWIWWAATTERQVHECPEAYGDRATCHAAALAWVKGRRTYRPDRRDGNHCGLCGARWFTDCECT